jgi:hypothetical protein
VALLSEPRRPRWRAPGHCDTGWAPSDLRAR